METLYYNRGRLAAAASFFLIVGLFLLYLWLDPSLTADMRRARWVFNGEFGRYVFSPLLIGTCLGMAFLAGSSALGDGKALEATRSHLIVGTLWGRKRVAFRDLRAFAVERSGGYPQLALEGDGIGTFGGSTLRVPLGAVQIHGARIPELLESIARLRAAALKPDPVPAAGQAIPEAGPALRARPAFGRKGS